MGFKTIATIASVAVTAYMFVLWTINATGIINWFLYALPRIIIGSIVFSLFTILLLGILFVGYFAIQHARYGTRFPHYKYTN